MSDVRLPVAIAALVALVATGLVLGNSEGTRVGAADPPPDLVGAIPGPVDVVQSFGAALRDGDAGRAASLVAADWTQLELPGLPWRSLGQSPSAVDLAAALEFYSDLVDVTVAGCRVRSHTSTTASAEVVCDMQVDSTYAEVSGVAGRIVPTTYWIRDDEIAGILRSHLGTPMIQSYCYWAERAGGTELFDTSCLLTIGSDHGVRHEVLSRDYLAAGRPGSGRAYAFSRGGIAVLGVMMRQHNQGGSPEVLVDREAAAGNAPGLLGGDPRLAEFVAWSKVVYRIEMGRCFVDGSGAPPRFTVHCPNAEWGGPLVAGLTLDPIPRDAQFTVQAASVRLMEGGTSPSLAAAWQRFCEWAERSRPQSAAAVIEPGCVPVYGENEGRALLMLLAEYAADPR